MTGETRILRRAGGIPKRERRRRLARFGAIVAVALAAAGAGPRSGEPPIALVETRPVETALGNPALAAALPTWIALIDGAKRTLDFEEFYLSTWPREPLEDVLHALGRAAKRGVHVRILLDARMYRTYPQPADSLGKVQNFAVRRIDFGRIAGGIQHSKFFIADGATVFLGSQNMDWRALKHIHELGARVRDARVAADFQRVFDLDWSVADPVGQPADTTRTFPLPAQVAARKDHPYAIMQAPGDTAWLWTSWSPRRFVPDTARWDRDRIVATLDAARSEIVLQLLNYGIAGRDEKDDALDQALRRAAARGVRVRLLISDWEVSSPGLEDLRGLMRVPNVEVKLSTLPEWSGGYIPFARVEHCKYVVADTEWTWVGTSNWEPSYFHSSRNIAVTIRNRPIAAAARRVFETSWLAPSAKPLDPLAKYPPKVRGEEPPPGSRKYGG